MSRVTPPAIVASLDGLCRRRGGIYTTGVRQAPIIVRVAPAAADAVIVDAAEGERSRLTERSEVGSLIKFNHTEEFYYERKLQGTGTNHPLPKIRYPIRSPHRFLKLSLAITPNEYSLHFIT